MQNAIAGSEGLFRKIALAPNHWRGIGIFSEGVRVASPEDFDHPMMKIVHGMIENLLTAAVLFFAGLIQF